MTAKQLPAFPRITVTYDESGIALHIQARPGGPVAPIVLTADDAVTLTSALQRAVDDRDALYIELDDIDNADPEDFRR